MGSEERATETSVLALPLPFQGHMNPMLQFSKRIASKGIRVTLVSFTNKVLIGENGPINVEVFPAYSSEEDDGYLNNLQATMRQTLPQIVAKHSESGFPVSCVIYDSLMPWVLDIARQLGLPGASLFTQSSAVNHIYYKLHEGKLNVPTEQVLVSVEGMPPLEIYDLPSFFYELEKYPTCLTFMANQFLNIEEADWVFFNTFNSLEDEVLRGMTSQWPVKSIGPTIPSMYLDKRVEDNREYGINLFKPNVENCMKWLDLREASSVVYVSFGSITDLGEKQMQELANGLKRSGHYFLWVVKEPEEKKLPSNFVEETLEKGLIVNWCSQLEVLAHKSIRCFMTHCGWNSTLEAFSLGVPMVAMPQWADQSTNAKYVADVWHVGVRVKLDEEGIVTEEEIELRIREVMEGVKANEIRKNSEKWKKLAREAVDEGGSSEKNIEEFVAELIRSSSATKL
ncbi:UDP-glucosyltransferase, putative [Ricinus communis]|uniref:Glycosyltransferase n=2 Tax=Ricinus communis TaxID=3988 RepID=B9SV03_RICCO|nr:UDP-glucosyltransferase, putative [Ricinus communis]|eukprot:XP_002529822.1 UDP-glycosyltransferase 74E2 [Ricinus communis]